MIETEILKNIPAFSSFDVKISELIQKTGNLITLEAGQDLFNSPDEIKSSLLIVMKGKLKISLKGTDQTTVMIRYLFKDDFWGEYGLFDGNNVLVDITAEEQSDVIVYDRKKIFNEFSAEPKLLERFIAGLISKLRQSQFAQDSLTVKDSDSKVARTILKLCIDSGIVKSGMVEIEKLPTQIELAKISGTSRETVSRTLHSFAKKGFVEIDGSKLRIKDFMKLREIIL